NIIGGPGAGEGNRIANNPFNGVEVNGNASVGNAIRGNSIYGNGLGIDLGGDGVTLNHNGGATAGPNKLQNYPTAMLATPGATSIEISGELHSAASTTFTIDFYASLKANASGYGEGAQYLGPA